MKITSRKTRSSFGHPYAFFSQISNNGITFNIPTRKDHLAREGIGPRNTLPVTLLPQASLFPQLNSAVPSSALVSAA